MTKKRTTKKRTTFEGAPLGGKQWKAFERITAAIHKLRDNGADVRWDEKIAGRQLDVTVRFERAGYSYLLIVECRNTGRPVSVTQVEALVTKARDLNANKAVMVAAAGYQKGAKEVAERHGVQLLRLDEFAVKLEPQDIEIKEPSIEILSAAVWAPDDAMPLVIATRHDLDRMCFRDIISGRVVSLIHVVRSKVTRDRITQLPPACRLLIGFGSAFEAVVPNRPNVRANRLEVTVRRTFTPKRITVVPPNLPFMEFVLTDVQTGVASRFAGADLPIGLDAPFIPGRFYKNILGLIYRCEKVDEENVQLYVFLGNQQPNARWGEMTARIVGPISSAPFYVELSDPTEVQKYKVLYESHVKAESGDDFLKELLKHAEANTRRDS